MVTLGEFQMMHRPDRTSLHQQRMARRAAGKTMAVDQSGDRRSLRRCRLGRRGRRRRRRRSCARGARRAVGQDVGARARPAGVEARRATDGAGRRGRAARDAAQRQADHRIAAHRDSRGGRVLPVLRRLGRQGAWARRFPSKGNDLIYTLREPLGVVAAIVPWNFPLLLAVWKVAPALAWATPHPQAARARRRSPRSRSARSHSRSGSRPAC